MKSQPGQGVEFSVKPPEKKEEKEVERPVVSQPTEPEETAAAVTITAAPTESKVVPPTKIKKSETLEKIEDIMEEDLGDVYQNMPLDVKEEFKEKGEETAEEIEGMLYHVKIKSQKIFKLLFGWMKIIPGVNKFFLKQEAKIKTDEIMDVKEDINKRQT